MEKLLTRGKEEENPTQFPTLLPDLQEAIDNRTLPIVNLDKYFSEVDDHTIVNKEKVFSLLRSLIFPFLFNNKISSTNTSLKTSPCSSNWENLGHSRHRRKHCVERLGLKWNVLGKITYFTHWIVLWRLSTNLRKFPNNSNHVRTPPVPQQNPSYLFTKT